MSKSTIPTTLRMALWRANAFKCWYCEQPVTYFDLQIDHIIPESTPIRRLRALMKLLGLPGGFYLNSPLNLVPAHARCNRQKSDTPYSEHALRHYFAVWGAKQPAVNKERQLLERQTSNSMLLSRLAAQIATGALTTAEAVSALRSAGAPSRSSSSEPLVVCFGTNVSDLINDGTLPADAPTGYALLCDWLEKELIEQLHGRISAPSIFSEPSSRNGETLSVRVAFWNLDVRMLDSLSLPRWQILEVLPFTEVYDDGWEDLFSRATVQAYHALLRKEPDRCPECGRKGVVERRVVDHTRDDVYYLYECMDCHWSDWSQ